MILTLSVLQNSIQRIIGSCIRSASGREICGYLLEDEFGAQEYFALENRFTVMEGCFVSILDESRARHYAEKNGLRLLALIHSHRVGLDMSDLDRDWFQHSDVAWIIVTLDGQELKWRFYPRT